MQSNKLFKKFIIVFLLFGFAAITESWAQDYPIKLINNSDNSLSVFGEVIDGSSSLRPQVLGANSDLEFHAENSSIFKLRARGLVTVTDVNNANNQCRFEYNNHSLVLTDELNHMELDSGFPKNNSSFCSSLFVLHGDKSICHGVNNCMVVNDDIQQVYQQNKDKSLTANVWLGTHNSTIANVYAQGKNVLDMSNTDPNQTLTLTQQLNQGVRVLELDLVAIQEQLKFCHFHIGNIPYDEVCDENTALKTGLQEVNQWLNIHPQAVVLIYLDINQPIADVAGFDQVVRETLVDAAGNIRVLSKQDVGNTLPASTLTPNDLLQNYKNKKNVIFINHDTAQQFNAQASDYVFNQVSNKLAIKIPYDRSVDDFTNCLGTFSEDESHQTLWGLRGDQSNLSGHGESTTITYNKIEQLPRPCTINYLAVDKLMIRDARISGFVDYAKQR